MKILVRAPNWIGDAVLSLPAVRSLKNRFPDGSLEILARPSTAALYSDESAVDKVIALPGAPGLKDLRNKWSACRELRRESFDLAVLLPNSFESAAIVWLAGAKRRIGYARDARSAFLTDPIAPPVHGEIPKHESYYYPELLRRAGLIERLPEIPEILLDRLDLRRARGLGLLDRHGLKPPVVAVNPGAAFGGAKRWLPERFAEAASAIATRMGASIAVFGASAESTLCEGVAAACNGHNLAGRTTLAEFIDITAACSLSLTNDSGAMHIAAACRVPSVTVFGPTDETATGPVGPLARLVRVPVDCAPCKLRECPIDHRCMTRVGADMVISALSDKL